MATLIAKGLQDRLGRIFQIQAAGMKYNQSLNSVALGSDTQATGKDQFVFGRANVTDDEKAEIVGGGIQSQGEQYYITEIKYTDGVQLLHGVAYYDNMLKSPLKVVVRQIAIPTAYESSGKYLAAYDIVEVVQQLEMNDQWYDSLASAMSSGGGTVTREEARQYFRSFEDVYEGDKLLREKYGSSSSYSWHIEALEVTSDGQYFRSKSGDGHSGSGAYDPNFNFVTYPTRKNIRTLGWDGTQWNAGDVTCDDGEGHTISLREVASRTPGGYTEGLPVFPDEVEFLIEYESGSAHITITQAMTERLAIYKKLLDLGSEERYLCALTIAIDDGGENTYHYPCICEVRPERAVNGTNGVVATFKFGPNLLELHRYVDGTETTIYHAEGQEIQSLF